jgi:serine/threonine protein kinase
MEDLRLSASFGTTRKVEVGEVLDGKYRVERVLGNGGMGVVVAARHLQLDQLVAIKLVLPETTRNDVLVARFLREARSAAKLRSEHVARVLDVACLADGAPYIVMEYLEGADLAAVLDSEGPLGMAEACDYMLQACHAIAEAHRLGIVHRDLKPENIYRTTRVGGASLIKVLDFGISKVMTSDLGALTQTRAVLGSPAYMAPEQLRSSRRADPRADVWALGVVLYELLTRRCPFEADSLPDLCLKVTREPPRPLDELRDDLPAELVQVIARCLEKDADRRFADAGELADALEPFAAAPPRPWVARTPDPMRQLAETMAAPPSMPTTAAVGARKWRVLTVTLTLLVVSLSVSGIWTGKRLARRMDTAEKRAFAAIDVARTAPSAALPMDPAAPPPDVAASLVTVPLVASVAATATAPDAGATTPPVVRYRPTRASSPPVPTRSRAIARDDIPEFR